MRDVLLRLATPEMPPQMLFELEEAANAAIKAGTPVTPSWHSVADVNDGAGEAVQHGKHELGTPPPSRHPSHLLPSLTLPLTPMRSPRTAEVEQSSTYECNRPRAGHFLPWN